MLLSVREAAALVACSERQIYRWIDEAEIPFQRIRDQVRFSRTDLLEWATSRRLPISLEALDAGLDPEDGVPSLARAIAAGGVHHDVADTNRDSALRAAVECTPMPASLDRDFVVETLIARENTISTAIGDGIAIPHVRQPLVAPGASTTVSVSYLRKPVSFGAADHQLVQIIFFIVSPTVRAHLQMLARLARTLQRPEFRDALDRRAATDELVAVTERLEQMPSFNNNQEGDSRGRP